MHDDSVPQPRFRYPAIDIARGVAIAAMALYHGAWDLAYHGLVGWDVVGDPAWRGFAVAIASSFLVLSGVSLTLAATPDLDMRRYGIRLVKVGAGAAAVTAATYVAMPDAFVFFGILHLIVVAGVLALPFLAAPAWMVLAAAGAALLAPVFLRSAAFDHPLLWWIGLSAETPVSNDYVPVLPWIAAVLAGVAAGRLVTSGFLTPGTGRPRSAVMRGLAVAGRWSLPIYLVHQPLLFGATAALALVLPVDPRFEAVRFSSACVAECVRGTGDGPGCDRFCGCVVGAMDGTGFFTIRGGDPAMGSLIATAAMSCRASEPLPIE